MALLPTNSKSAADENAKWFFNAKDFVITVQCSYNQIE